MGIDPVLSLMLQAGFGPISRFPRRAALACHAGLVTHVDSSGDRVSHRAHYARWVAVAAVDVS